MKSSEIYQFKVNPVLSSFVIGITGTFLIRGILLLNHPDLLTWILTVLILFCSLFAMVVNLILIIYSEPWKQHKSEALFFYFENRKSSFLFFVYRAFNRALLWFSLFIVAKLLFPDTLPGIEHIRHWLLAAFILIVVVSSLFWYRIFLQVSQELQV